jgi:putative ABC transport system permease protein
MIAQFQENLQTALQSLLANKLRTALSLLGILIGVGAVVALLAAGQGVRDYIQRQVEAIGPNVLFVFPGGFSQSGLTRAAAQQSGLMRPALTLGDAQALQDPPGRRTSSWWPRWWPRRSRWPPPGSGWSPPCVG